MKRFLADPNYSDDEFFTEEDNEDIDPSDPFITLPIDPNTKFVFDDYSFAKKVRARVWELLLPYDVDKNE